MMDFASLAWARGPTGPPGCYHENGSWHAPSPPVSVPAVSVPPPSGSQKQRSIASHSSCVWIMKQVLTHSLYSSLHPQPSTVSQSARLSMSSQYSSLLGSYLHELAAT